MMVFEGAADYAGICMFVKYSSRCLCSLFLRVISWQREKEKIS